MLIKKYRTAAWGLIMAFAFGVILPSGYAFTDEIGMMPHEIWPALEALGKEYGISKSDESEGKLTTKWIEDTVKRSRGITKGILFQTYQRRYRMTVKLHEQRYTTLIEIRGKYEERPGNSRPADSWRRVKPESDDYLQERLFFNKLLVELGKQRMLLQVESQKSAEENPPKESRHSPS